jgi:DsbC/DsbD-like thiol-disulfide interchange protein
MAVGLTAPVAAQPRRAATEPAHVRLIGALAENDGQLLAGVHVALASGWKTYWRVPGDSGLPPQFDFTRSRNLAGAEVLYPAPERFQDGSGHILGYAREVVFPVRVRPRDPSRPVELALTLDFGVCERICIPTQAMTKLVIGRMSPTAADAGLLRAHLARVPRAVAAGTSVTQWRVDRATARLAFHATLAGGVDHAVVEGPTERTMPLPRLDRRGDGLMAHVDVARVLDLHAGQALRVTVVGPVAAVEELRTLDE